MESDKTPYQKEWEELLTREIQNKKGRLLTPLIVIIGLFGLWNYSEDRVIIGVSSFIISFLIGIYFIYSNEKYLNWRCPACRSNNANRYFGIRGIGKGNCSLCGLKKWEGSNIEDEGFWSNGL